MNRYLQIRRLRWPAILLLVGVIALLDQLGVIDNWWNFTWPLALILFGVFMLAERAALAAEGGYPGYYPGGYPGNPGAGNPGAPYTAPGAANPTATTNPAQASTSIVPAPVFDLGKRPDGEEL
jgi:hypothetical protein